MSSIDSSSPDRGRWLTDTRLAILIVAALLLATLVFLGREASIVRQRDAFMRWVDAGPGWYRGPDIVDFGVPAHIPIWRIWMGDRAQLMFCLPTHAKPADMARAKELFPEVREGMIIGPPLP
jgi:hypothetical protein